MPASRRFAIELCLQPNPCSRHGWGSSARADPRMQSAVAGAGRSAVALRVRAIAATANPVPRRAHSTKRALSTHLHPTTANRPRNPHRPFGQGAFRETDRLNHRGEIAMRSARGATQNPPRCNVRATFPGAAIGPKVGGSGGTPSLGGTPAEASVLRGATWQTGPARASHFRLRTRKRGISSRGSREVWRHATIDHSEAAPICFMRFNLRVRPRPATSTPSSPDRSALLTLGAAPPARLIHFRVREGFGPPGGRADIFRDAPTT